MRYSRDDVAVFLALLEQGTTGRAAEALGCSQPTVVRRIAALENALGLSLFVRSSTGLEPTEAALALRPAAQNLECAAFNLDQAAREFAGEHSRTIKLTLLDHFSDLFIPILREFHRDWPDVRVEIMASDRMFDLARGEADIALRGRVGEETDAVVVRRLPDGAWTLYASSDTPEDERPRDWDEARSHVIATLDSGPAKLPAYQFVERLVADSENSLRCSNFAALRSAVVSGNALAVLPVTIGDRDPHVVRCFAPPAEFDVGIFLLGRRAALRRAPAKALYDRIHDHFRDNPWLLNGRNRP